MVGEKQFPNEFTAKTTPVTGDLLLIADSEDSNRVKKILYSNVKGDKGDAITWKGAYNGATAYIINDAVSYTDGLSYICILASTGNIPTNVTYWGVLITPVNSTNVIKGVGLDASTTQVTAGTDSSSGVSYHVLPSQLKTTNDNLADEALKIKSKVDVVAATTANITLSNTQTIDGVSVVAGNRVLVKDQSTASQNGIYLCVSGGAWTRATYFDQNLNNEVDLGAEVWVQGGTIGAGTQWTLTTTGAITVGTTATVFTQTYPIISYVQTIASDTLQKSADTVQQTLSASPTKTKEIRARISGDMRIKFDMKKDSFSSTAARGQIYINGVAVGTLQSITTSTYVTYSEDLYVRQGDLLQLYISLDAGGSAPDYGTYRNFRIYYDKINSGAESTVILN